MSVQELSTSLDTVEPAPARRAIRKVFPIHAQTRMEAWVVRVEAKNTPELSLLSLQLADGFALGRKRPVDYIVGGPYPKLSNQLVLNGLRMNDGHALPGLRIVLVSPASPTPDLLQAAKAKRVRLEHRPLD